MLQFSKTQTPCSMQDYQQVFTALEPVFQAYDSESLLDTVLEQMQGLSQANAGALFLVEGQTQAAQIKLCRVQEGDDEPRPSQVIVFPAQGEGNEPSNIILQCYEQSQVVVVDRPDQAANYDFTLLNSLFSLPQKNSASFYAVPLLDERQRVLAIIVLMKQADSQGDRQYFEEGGRERLRIFSELAASSIEQMRRADQQRRLLIEFSAEKNSLNLIERILNEAKAITMADGGSLYLYKESHSKTELEFALVLNDSLGLNMGGRHGSEVTLEPIPLLNADGSENHHNMVSSCALRKKEINVEDMYKVSGYDFEGTKAFDKAHDYYSKSFLTVPLLNHDGLVIGVMQLVNAQSPLSAEVIGFSEEMVTLVKALASYAALALNNQILVLEMKELLDSFVKCIAQAIDAKSSHTSAHCQRIPLLMQMIAQAACDDTASFSDFQLDEDQWYEVMVSAWMHDCGKLATPDGVLNKSTKLERSIDGIELVKLRFNLMAAQAKLRCSEAQLAEPGQKTQALDCLHEELARIEEDRDFIMRSNKGGEFMSEEDQQKVKSLAQLSWRDEQGQEQTILNEEEIYNLCIERGTLTHEEREQINNHIVVTLNMLESLPFPRKLRNVPEFAGGHHEKMDGTGFPKGLTREQMSIPARMMAVADVFEALTAKERPYKDPMRISMALGILKRMVENNHLDPDIYQLFVQNRVWEAYAKQELLPEQLDIDDCSEFLLSL